MTHASLFSGIGACELAAQWLGWENVFHCEKNPFCNTVLNYYWPNAESFEDIKTSDFKKYRGSIDVLSGGFPCQPYSSAGKRLGKEDDRHLWPEFLRAIREIQPRYVVGENVRGLINWSKGLVFIEVQTDLENEGYEVIPFLLPASGVNAPHERYRIWFIAHSKSDTRNDEPGNEEQGTYSLPCERFNEPFVTANTSSNGHKLRGFGENRQAPAKSKSKQKQWQWIRSNSWRIGKPRQPSHTHSSNVQGRINTQGQEKTERYTGSFDARNGSKDWQDFPTQQPIRKRDDGIYTGLSFESVFRGVWPSKEAIPAGRWHKESLKALGNSMVPQLVFRIFKAIEACENQTAN